MHIKIYNRYQRDVCKANNFQRLIFKNFNLSEHTLLVEFKITKKLKQFVKLKTN